MKTYKLINIKIKEEHLCDKVTIDGFDYYEKLKKNYYSNTGQTVRLPKSNKEFQAMGVGYIDGFNTHKNLIKDKLFTIEDMKKAIEMSRQYPKDVAGFSNNEILKSLLPKTEWEVEFDEQGKLKLI